ncbi:DUF4407 domain-containing protein [Rhodococcus sp. HM1]|nr:DUF4407 domain-containing protein [Rhodococcus sp. HM1]
MGAVVLTTAFFAALSAGYALYITGVTNGWILAVVAGLLWGLAILNLDRMLILGLSQERDWKKLLMLGAPRVALAIIIGIVISTPLMLKVFESEIEAQLNRNILAAQEQLRSDLNNSTASADLAEAEAELGELRALINAGPTADPAANPKVQSVQTEIDALEAKAAEQKAEYDKLQAAAVAEEEGSAGTGIAGCAAMCVEKRRLANEAMGRWEDTRAQISAKEGDKDRLARELEGTLLEESERRIADAQTELPIVEQTVTQLREQIASAQDTSFQLEQANQGIIARLKALNDLSEGDGTAAMAHRAVALLFMCLELLPVLFKVLSNLGQRTAYDEVVAKTEDAEAAAATAEIDAMRDREKLRTDAKLEAEKDRIDKQQAAVLKINEAVVSHQVDVIDAALERWTDHAKATASQRLNGWAATLGGNSASGMPPRPSATPVYLAKNGVSSGTNGRPTPRSGSTTSTLVDPLPDPSEI